MRLRWLVSPEDFRLQRMIEAILVRNYVDTSKVDVEVISGNVYLDGVFEVVEARDFSKEHLTTELVERHYAARRVLLSIEQQIRAMGQVNGLSFSFKNWSKGGGGWVPVKMG